MSEGSAVKLEAPSFENKININTIWITICVLGAIGAAVVYGASQASMNERQNEWQTQHVADHAARRLERQRLDTEANAKNILQDTQLAEAISKLDRMGDRITANEEGIRNANARSDRLADAVGDLRGAIQESNQKLAVVQTILERIENKQSASLGGTPPELNPLASTDR